MLLKLDHNISNNILILNIQSPNFMHHRMLENIVRYFFLLPCVTIVGKNYNLSYWICMFLLQRSSNKTWKLIIFFNGTSQAVKNASHFFYRRYIKDKPDICSLNINSLHHPPHMWLGYNNLHMYMSVHSSLYI